MSVAWPANPRSRRTLIITVIAAAAIAGGGTVAYRLLNSHRGHTANEVYGTFGAFGISDGDTPQELLSSLGSPNEKLSGCWIYRVSGNSFHGTKIGPQIAGVDAVRYCFFSGVVSIIEDHWRAGTYNLQLGPWQAPVVYGCGDHACANRAP